MKGYLTEVFSSYQGEGPYAGARQVFVRLAGCHLRCAYCDTPGSWVRPESWRLEGRSRPNPAGLEDVLAAVDELRAGERHHSVSFTGGEPLLQAEFLRAAMAGVRERGLPVYLDTSGTLADRLARVADLVDIFAFDVKLPSSGVEGANWDDARACLQLARGREAFVKVVVTGETREEDVARAAALVPPEMPMFLQPVTPAEGRVAGPDGAALVRFRRAAAREIVVLPQLHPIAGWK